MSMKDKEQNNLVKSYPINLEKVERDFQRLSTISGNTINLAERVEISTPDTTPENRKFKNTLKDLQKQLGEFSNELAAIKSNIIDTPEKVLSLPLMRKDIEGMRSEISDLRDRVKNAESNRSANLGIIITLILGFIALMVTIILA